MEAWNVMASIYTVGNPFLFELMFANKLLRCKNFYDSFANAFCKVTSQSSNTFSAKSVKWVEHFSGNRLNLAGFTADILLYNVLGDQTSLVH